MKNNTLNLFIIILLSVIGNIVYFILGKFISFNNLYYNIFILANSLIVIILTVLILKIYIKKNIAASIYRIQDLFKDLKLTKFIETKIEISFSSLTDNIHTLNNILNQRYELDKDFQKEIENEKNKFSSFVTNMKDLVIDIEAKLQKSFDNMKHLTKSSDFIKNNIFEFEKNIKNVENVNTKSIEVLKDNLDLQNELNQNIDNFEMSIDNITKFQFDLKQFMINNTKTLDGLTEIINSLVSNAQKLSVDILNAYILINKMTTASQTKESEESEEIINNLKEFNQEIVSDVYSLKNKLTILIENNKDMVNFSEERTEKIADYIILLNNLKNQTDDIFDAENSLQINFQNELNILNKTTDQITNTHNILKNYALKTNIIIKLFEEIKFSMEKIQL